MIALLCDRTNTPARLKLKMRPSTTDSAKIRYGFSVQNFDAKGSIMIPLTYTLHQN